MKVVNYMNKCEAADCQKNGKIFSFKAIIVCLFFMVSLMTLGQLER